MRFILAAVAVLVAIPTSAQDLTLEDLVGAWIFESYAETETPDERRPVGAATDFRSDGTVVMTLGTGDTEATFMLDGDTIRYYDSNGEQIWQIRSYDPGESFVVEYQRALMYFVRADTE